LVTGAALLPDVDLAFRFVDGRNHHNNEVHSVGAALVVALAAALALRALRWPRALPAALAVGLAFSSHLLLDYLNVDTNPPIGLMALWPFAQGHLKSPIPIFLDVGRAFDWPTIRHNTLAVAWECVVLVPLCGLAWRFRQARGPADPGGAPGLKRSR
jgi:membrane-bound metal-dependent hydrolase YbcI (DUF457 family)